MIDKVGRKRLAILERFLRKEVPPRRFDMLTWISGAKFCGIVAPPEALHKECGSTACALGWATTIPAFKRAGLRFDGGSPYFLPPDTKYGSYSFNAGAAFFHIRIEDANYLFEPSCYPTLNTTPTEVASRIRGLLKGGKRHGT